MKLAREDHCLKDYGVIGCLNILFGVVPLICTKKIFITKQMQRVGGRTGFTISTVLP